MPKKKVKRRRVWTDEERVELVREVERSDNKKETLRRLGVSDSWYYRHARTPRFLSMAEKGTKPAEKTVKTFQDASAEEKYAMIREYDQLPIDEKRPWRKARGLTTPATDSLLSYHRRQMRKKSLVIEAAPVPGEAVTAESLIAEYVRMPQGGPGRKGPKSEFLRKWGINHQQAWAWKTYGTVPQAVRDRLNRVAETSKALIPVSALTAPTPKKRGPQRRSPKPIPVIPAEQIPETLHREPTLSEAIDVLAMKRDIYHEIVDLLTNLKTRPR